MIYLLSRLFIKSKDLSDNKVREQYGIITGSVGIFLNLLISAAKITMGALTGAISIIADGVNNVTDAGSSIISMLGFKLSNKPMDSKHPFGHGRVEYISGLLVAMLILVVGVELAITSVENIITPPKIEISVIAMVVLGVSIAVKIYMFAYNLVVSKKINSQALRATAIDSISDAASTAAVLVGSIIAYYSGLVLDSYIGLLVAGLIVFGGTKSIREVVAILIGTKPDPEFIKNISDKVLSYPLVIGIHDLVVHDYGVGRSMITLHAEVSADNNIMEVHDCIDNIEQDLQDTFKCHAVIHMDPVYTNDERLNAVKDALKEIIPSIDQGFTFHDVRMNQGPTHTNVIFDLVITPEYLSKTEELTDNISKKVQERLGASYFCVIKIDLPYC